MRFKAAVLPDVSRCRCRATGILNCAGRIEPNAVRLGRMAAEATRRAGRAKFCVAGKSNHSCTRGPRLWPLLLSADQRSRVVHFDQTHSAMCDRFSAWRGRCVKGLPVEYRRIRYTLRAGIERNGWTVSIHPAGIEGARRVVTGSRERAELLARSMIDRWYKYAPRRVARSSELM